MPDGGGGKDDGGARRKFDDDAELEQDQMSALLRIIWAGAGEGTHAKRQVSDVLVIQSNRVRS